VQIVEVVVVELVDAVKSLAVTSASMVMAIVPSFAAVACGFVVLSWMKRKRSYSSLSLICCPTRLIAIAGECSIPIFMGLCFFEDEFLFVNNSRSEKKGTFKTPVIFYALLGKMLEQFDTNRSLCSIIVVATQRHTSPTFVRSWISI
jgi:hypothetical protein